jgi:hypothetical protein
MMAEKSYSYNLLGIYGVKMYLVSMILIHNDNSYGIMIPERFSNGGNHNEQMIHRNCMKNIYWIQGR